MLTPRRRDVFPHPSTRAALRLTSAAVAENFRAGGSVDGRQPHWERVGASVLMGELLDAGYTDVTVLDLARSALAIAESRLGSRASSVHWLEADVGSVALPRGHYAVWHDRAVFHFLTERADRDAYVAQVERAVRPGGHVLVATFAEDGPTQCSGLPVARYSAAGLHGAFGSAFELLSSEREEHVTPAGAHQSFVYCLCRRA